MRDVHSSDHKAVLVTGTSTGIGRSITERLAADGYFVYAGARKASDLQSLGRIDRVRPLRLDVTDQSDIAAAVRTITTERGSLYGLVNNAGVASLGGILDGDDEEFQLVMQVNVSGSYRITKALAPLIVAGRGRIVSIGSISGILAGASVLAYSMSKHALEALTDSLAEEMAPLGVYVSVVEPGRCDTRLVDNVRARLGNRKDLPDLADSLQPAAVAVAVARALLEPRPKRRYLVAAPQDVEATLAKQIEQLVQLNEAHPYSYDRNALVRMLDHELSRSKAHCAGAVAPNDTRTHA